MTIFICGNIGGRAYLDYLMTKIDYFGRLFYYSFSKLSKTMSAKQFKGSPTERVK